MFATADDAESIGERGNLSVRVGDRDVPAAHGGIRGDGNVGHQLRARIKRARIYRDPHSKSARRTSQKITPRQRYRQVALPLRPRVRACAGQRRRRQRCLRYDLDPCIIHRRKRPRPVRPLLNRQLHVLQTHAPAGDAEPTLTSIQRIISRVIVG